MAGSLVPMARCHGESRACIFKLPRLSSNWVGRSGRSSVMRTRGKSGHLRAACHAQAAGAYGASLGNGKCHRKDTAHLTSKEEGRVRVKW